MKFRELLRSKIFIIFVLFFLVYAVFSIVFSQYKDIWWDAAAYIGIGKFIFSGGQSGLIEPMKPMFLPLFLGIFYKLGLNIVIFGKLLIFILSLVSLAFVYLIGREFFDEKKAFVASLILFANSLFFVFTFRIYSEMLSICFILGAIFFMIKFARVRNNWFIVLSALFCAMAFMSKYPNILLVVILNMFLLYCHNKKRITKEIILFNLSFIIFILPFFILGYSIGGGPLYLWNVSQEYFKAYLGHLYGIRAFPGIPKTFFETTNLIYFKTIFYLFNVLIPFIFIGMWKILRERKERIEKIMLLILPAILLFLFYEIVYLKQDRYILLIFPFLSLFAAYGLFEIRSWKRVFVIVIYVIISLAIIVSALSASVSEMSYWKFYSEPPINLSCEKVATSDPRSVLYYDNIIFPYEVFDKTWEGGFIEEKGADCVFYFSCYGEREEQVKRIEQMGFESKYEKDTGRCLYVILAK